MADFFFFANIFFAYGKKRGGQLLKVECTLYCPQDGKRFFFALRTYRKKGLFVPQGHPLSCLHPN